MTQVATQEDCRHCEGSGEVQMSPTGWPWWDSQTIVCQRCGGLGIEEASGGSAAGTDGTSRDIAVMDDYEPASDHPAGAFAWEEYR